MKQFSIYLLFLLGSFIAFTSCRSSYVVSLETQKPPTIIIPGKVEGVLIANNAVPQPGNGVIRLKVNKKEIDLGQTVETDSIIWNTAESVAKFIDEANFYDKVLIFEDYLRTDDSWLSTLPLSNEECDSLYKESGCNTIITIDRLLFNVQQVVVSSFEEYFLRPDQVFIYLKCNTLLSSSVYYKEKRNRLTSFSLQDSAIMSVPIYADSTEIFQKMPSYVISALTRVVSEKLANLFIPEWEISKRVVFTWYNSRMNEANKFFEKKKWTQARNIWESEYNKKIKLKEKGRLALNIAITHEMEDSLESAKDWVKKAIYQYSQTEVNKLTKDKAIANEYLEKLDARMQKNRILDIQSE